MTDALNLKFSVQSSCSDLYDLSLAISEEIYMCILTRFKNSINIYMYNSDRRKNCQIRKKGLILLFLLPSC